MKCACTEEDGAIVSLCLGHRVAMTANGLAGDESLRAEIDRLKRDLLSARHCEHVLGDDRDRIITERDTFESRVAELEGENAKMGLWKARAFVAESRVGELEGKLRVAEQLIERGVEIMSPTQVGQWDGVRAWQEAPLEAYSETDSAKAAGGGGEDGL